MNIIEGGVGDDEFEVASFSW